jgi:hypothetical protein
MTSNRNCAIFLLTKGSTKRSNNALNGFTGNTQEQEKIDGFPDYSYKDTVGAANYTKFYMNRIRQIPIYFW